METVRPRIWVNNHGRCHLQPTVSATIIDSSLRHYDDIIVRWRLSSKVTLYSGFVSSFIIKFLYWRTFTLFYCKRSLGSLGRYQLLCDSSHSEERLVSRASLHKRPAITPRRSHPRPLINSQNDVSSEMTSKQGLIIASFGSNSFLSLDIALT
jgi:hypothetical protein